MSVDALTLRRAPGLYRGSIAGIFGADERLRPMVSRGLPWHAIVGSSPAVDRCLGDHRVQGHVPGFGLDPVDALALVREADEPRPLPIAAAAQERETAIIEARPHADPVTVVIESDQGHQDKIKAMGRQDLPVAAGGFGDAVPVWAQWLAGSMANEPKPSGGMAAQHGQVPAPVAVESLNEGPRVELAACRDIKRDPASRTAESTANEPGCDSPGMLLLLTAIQLAPSLSEAAA
jgi:hypothetical protein